MDKSFAKEFLAIWGAIILFMIGMASVRVIDSVNTLIQHKDYELTLVAGNLNRTLIASTATIEQSKKTLVAIETTSKKVAVLTEQQTKANEALNARIGNTLEQFENTLLNAQLVMGDVDDNQKKASEALIHSINDLSPLLTHTTLTIDAAGKLLSDPNLTQTAKNLQTATASLAQATQNVATGTQTIDHVLEEFAKPKNLIWSMFKQALGLGADAKTILK